MSSSTFSRSLTKLPVTLEAEHVDPQRAQALPCRRRRWRPAGCRGRGTACPWRRSCFRRTRRSAGRPPGSRPWRQHLARPRRPARRTRMFSIFIASITASRSPARTFWPGCTATSTSRPGIGDSRNLLRSGGALYGISACSSAARGDSTSASICVPLCVTRIASGFLPTPRSTCAVNGLPLHGAVDARRRRSVPAARIA